MTKNKNKNIVSALLAISLVLNFGGVVKTEELFTTPEAKAEGSCPASVPSTHMVIRSGSANGPILGTYDNEGWNLESGPPGMGTVATLQVPSGTVLYYNGWTEGVELTNRSPGSTHSISGSATVTAPGNKAGYYPSGYYFSKQQNVSGYTTPITANRVIHVGAHNSCWGGFDDGESWISVQIQVAGGGGNPSTIIRSATNSLAIVKNPTVSLLVNGATSATVPVGSTPNLTWATDSVNMGNSCVASNNNSDSSWTGPKVGQEPYTPPQPPPRSGGTQDLDPLNSVGTFTYTIQCFGLNNVASAPASVTITVGNGPYYTCRPIPVNQSIPRGGAGTVTINTERFNGHNSAITYSAQVTGPAGNAPVITFQNNGQTPPDSPATVAVITTDSNTTLGDYQITFTGTGGVNCLTAASISVTSSATPDANIFCEGLNPECEISSGQTATISWNSSNVDDCEIYQNPPVVIGTGTSGSLESAPLTQDTPFSIYCDGPNGSATDLVTVRVRVGPGGLEPPTNVVASNDVCGEINITWSPPTSGTPTGYNIYRKPFGGSYGRALANNVSSPYTDRTAFLGPLYVYGVTALYGGTETTPPVDSNAISLRECRPDLTGSDKDTISIGSLSADLNGCNNSPDIPTGFKIANSGDNLRFRICVINSGTVDLTSVTLTELPNANEYTRNLTNIQLTVPDPLDGDACPGSPSGMTWVIGNMPAQTPFRSCYIYVTAKIADPNGPTGDLYRVQNIANITANYAGGSISKQVRSSLIFFMKGGGIPDRNETPPR